VDANAAWDVSTPISTKRQPGSIRPNSRAFRSRRLAAVRQWLPSRIMCIANVFLKRRSTRGLDADTHFVPVVLTVCGGCVRAGTDLAAGFPRLRVETPGLASGLSRMWRGSVPGQH
jgi:hypothetical protein